MNDKYLMLEFDCVINKNVHATNLLCVFVNKQSAKCSAQLSVVLNYGVMLSLSIRYWSICLDCLARLRLSTEPIRYAVCYSSFFHSNVFGLRKHTQRIHSEWFHGVSEATASCIIWIIGKRGSTIEPTLLLSFIHIQLTRMNFWV